MKLSLRKVSWLSIPLVSGLWLARQFNNPHFASCVIDDAILQMSWVGQFSQVLKEGVWLPRWLPDSNGGYGSPVFIFYSPLVYYVSASLFWLTDSIVLSMKLVRWLGLCLSGFAMIAYVQRFTSKRLAFMIALIYISLPFHVLDLSYWSLYAGTWAWIWFPLILLFLDRILDLHPKPTTALSGFSLCIAGLILTHLVSAYLFIFVILAYVIFNFPKSATQKVVVRFVLGVFLGLGLAAFFLVPVIVERSLVHMEYSMLLPEFNFRNTFLFFPDANLMAANPFQARTIPLLQFVALLQMTLMVISLAIIWKAPKLELRSRQSAFFWSGSALCCLFLMSRPSTWLWDLVPGLAQIQFSTRWMSIQTLASSLLIGLALGEYPEKSSPKSCKWLKLGHFSLCFVACFSSVVIVLGGCFLGKEEEELAATNVYNAPEYNPRRMPNWRQRVIETSDPIYTVIQGTALVRVDQWQAQSRRLHVEAEGPARLKLRLFNYPGWVITANKDRLYPKEDPSTGGMVIGLAPGAYDLRIEFTDTWWRRMASLVSLLSVSILGASLLRQSLSRREFEADKDPGPLYGKGDSREGLHS